MKQLPEKWCVAVNKKTRKTLAKEDGIFPL